MFVYHKCYISIELTFLKELMLIKQCHDLLMISMNLSDIAILNVKGSDYGCIISFISKNEAINLMQNADLTKKQNIIKHQKNYYHI